LFNISSQYVHESETEDHPFEHKKSVPWPRERFF